MPHPLPPVRPSASSPRVAAFALLLSACSPGERVAQRAAERADTARRDSAAATLVAAPVVDTGVPTPIAATLARPSLRRRRPPALSPAADSVAQRLVFVPRTQTWFIAAARGKRMLLDLGRADLDLRRAPELRAGFLEAAATLSPLPVGARVRLRGPWGEEDAAITGFDGWNGRIVATLAVSPALDSLARVREPLVGAALRLPDAPADSVAGDSAATLAATTDSASPAAANPVPTASAPSSAAPAATGFPPVAATTPPDSLACARDSISALLLERAVVVRDSLLQELMLREMPPIERMRQTISVAASQAPGCYGVLGRLALLVSLRAAANEYVRERFVVLDDSGAVTALRVSDYRFKGHDALYAFDADADGVDDLAAKAIGERTGGMVVLRLDPGRRRAERIAGGFAWESR